MTEGRSEIVRPLASVIVVAVSTTIAAWWLIGDLSFAGRPRELLDYMMRAPKVPTWMAPTLGLAALGSAIVALAALSVATRRNEIDDRWWGVLLALMAAGLLLAGVGRVITAGVVGANIGGGFALMFGLPFCAVLIGWAMFNVRRILRSDNGAGTGDSLPRWPSA